MSIVAKTQDNLKMCKCMTCPSYTTSCKIKEIPHNIIEELKGIQNTDSLESMFCAYTKSRCIDDDKGCMCNQCEVHDKYDLDDGHYCLSDGGY